MKQTEKQAIKNTLRDLAARSNVESEKPAYRLTIAWIRTMLSQMGHYVAVDMHKGDIVLMTIKFEGDKRTETIFEA